MNPFNPFPKNFTTHFAAYLRVETSTREPDIAKGLEARIADPAWSLGRQWQMSEFAGMDRGAPVTVVVDYRVIPLARVRYPGDASDAYPPASYDAMAEKEAAGFDTRRALRTGQHFERLLKKNLVGTPNAALTATLLGDFRRKFPFNSHPPGPDDRDAAGSRWRKMAGMRIVDGNALAVAPAGDYPIAQASPVYGLVLSTVAEWKQWMAGLYFDGRPAASWNAERFRHSYDLAGADPGPAAVEIASEGGDAEWYQGALKAAPGQGTRLKFPAAPVRVTFAGMPLPRWWAFEDSRTRFGAMEAGPTDIAKLAMIEFALCFGNDWFVVPFQPPLGCLLQIESLTVIDSFGRRTPIINPPPGANTPVWRVFELSRRDSAPAGAAPVHFIPAASSPWERSAPIEEVHFRPDENAEVTWAIERIVSDTMGEPMRTQDLPPGLPGNPDPAGNPDGARDYRLMSALPPTWFPFIQAQSQVPVVPVGNLAGTPSAPSRLVRAIVMPDAPGPARDAQGRILGPDASGLKNITESSVGPRGAILRLIRSRTRTPDGRTLTFLTRTVSEGPGEASSGLRFDLCDRTD